MANRMENQAGIKKETTYNTPVTVDRFLPYLNGTNGDWDTRQRQGMGMFVGTKRGYRGDRRVLPIGQGKVMLKAELASKQGAILLEAALGVATLTLVSGATNQINARSSIAGTVGPSYTIQLGKVRNDGTVDAETYAGCTVTSWEIECPKDGILVISVEFDARSIATATALATASYTAGAYLFDHSQGVATVAGSVTQPTTVTLASGGTVFPNFLSWKFSCDNNADTGRWVLGGRNQPTWGVLTPKFSAQAEYNDLVLRALFLAGTGFPIVITHTTTEALSTGFSQFQLSIPQFFLDDPVFPPMDTDTSVVAITGDTDFDGTSELFYLCLRTADTTV